LMKSKFLKVINIALKMASLQPLQGHGIHIGATLGYLLCGIPFDVVKAIDHLASSTFEIYLRKHAQIIAP
ncbi:hypothetical protein B0H10DRAFT_1729909, partial [Mycena sp. CBHHK59/15]